MITASDGSAFTGSVTVSVTGDAGTQATGSVGSGACTHEGNGYHTYAPAQAETNYDLVAFTFTGTGAIPVTVQVYTTFPQTGDNFARTGAPAGASVSADIAAIKSETAAIVADTNELQTDDIPGTLATIAAYLDTEVAAILEDTGTTLPATLSTIASYIDTEIAAIKAVTDNLPDSGALTSLAAAAELAKVPKSDGTTSWNATALAAINAQLLDVLSTDTFAEPSGVPAATTTLATKIGYLYMALRNQVDVTATKKTFYDDGGAGEWSKTLSDNGTTYSEAEGSTP